MSHGKQNTLPVPMLSKVGKHISQRLTGLGSKKHRSPRHPLHAQSPNKPLEGSPLNNTYNATVERIRNMRHLQFKPCVGHYKVKYGVIDKNSQRINFKKLQPHFARDKASNNFTQTQYNSLSDTASYRVTGMQEFDRMTSREDIKGSIRKTGENPHQRRFELRPDNGWDGMRAMSRTASFQKMMRRKIQMFKPVEFSPDYYPNVEFGKKKLALSVIPFEKQIERDETYLVNKNSSQLRDSYDCKSVGRGVRFDKLLPRYQQEYLPSYLDTGINSRLSLNQCNWKTLKMNCHPSRTLNCSTAS